MQRQQQHETPLGELHERVVGEGERPVKCLLAAQRRPQHQEVQRQEEGEGDAREPVREPGEPGRMIPRLHGPTTA